MPNILNGTGLKQLYTHGGNFASGVCLPQAESRTCDLEASTHHKRENIQSGYGQAEPVMGAAEVRNTAGMANDALAPDLRVCQADSSPPRSVTLISRKGRLKFEDFLPVFLEFSFVNHNPKAGPLRHVNVSLTVDINVFGENSITSLNCPPRWLIGKFADVAVMR